MRDIYDYVDYRKYLSDWFQSKKAEKPNLSHRWFARKMGTSDPSALANVISGRRSVSGERVEQLVRALDLAEPEARYFRAMVDLDEAGRVSVDEKQRRYAQLAALRAAVRPPLDAEHLEVMRSVRYLAIREFARCVGFRGDPAWIGAQFDPPLPEAEVRDTLLRMERLGLMRQRDGRWEASESDVQTGPAVPALASLDYHLDADELARRAMAAFPANEAQTSFTGHTLAVPREKLGELRLKLWEAFHQVALAADTYAAPDCVVQVNIRMFPLTVMDDEGGR